MLFAEFIYSNYTKLGDTERFLSASITFEPNILISSTKIMEFTGSIFSYLGTPFYHIPALLLSYFGIVYLQRAIERIGGLDSKSNRIIFFLLIAVPSFSIWTSIHSKEAVTAFCMCILASQLIASSLSLKSEVRLISYLALYLIAIFKPQYGIALVSCFIFIKVSRKYSLKAFTQLSFVFSIIIVQAYLLLGASDLIDFYANNMYQYFNTSGDNSNSTRINDIFVHDGDFFRNAPYGMLVAFIGPKWSEVVENPLFFPFYLESLFIIFLFLTLLTPFFKNLLKGKVNVFICSLVFLGLFWLLLVHYPFGIFNPGSAIRYRENFYPFIVALFFLANAMHKNLNYRI
jgi:hypothetical protein